MNDLEIESLLFKQVSKPHYHFMTKIINVFEFNAKTYCNCWDKKSKKVFLMIGE